MRETITGVLHVIHDRKPPKGGLLEQHIVGIMQDAGVVPIEYFPPRYFIWSEQTIGQRRAADAPHQNWRKDEPYQFQFKGRPKQFSPDLRGHLVTVRATVEPFQNNLGGYLHRPEVLEVGEYVECPHHVDPYDDPIPGSGRIFCKRPPVWPVKAEGVTA